MAIRNIVFSPSETLKKISKEVKIFDDNLAVLLDDMYDTMVYNYGVGLAGPQVGVLKRVVVIEVNGIKLDLVNPKIIKKEGVSREVEGCLSVKGVQGWVTRPEKVTITAFDRYGNPFEFTGTGLMAQCICHELDHLDGILFTDVMDEVYVSHKSKKNKK